MRGINDSLFLHYTPSFFYQVYTGVTHMAGTVSKKLGIKDGSRAILVNAPADAIDDIALPPLEIADELRGEFDYIHFFVESQDEFNEMFPKLKAHLKPTGMLWVSWRKSSKSKTGLSLPIVIELGYNFGLV